MTEPETPSAARLEAFAEFADVLADVHVFLAGERAKFLAEGYSETAAEQMAVALFMAWLAKAFA